MEDAWRPGRVTPTLPLDPNSSTLVRTHARTHVHTHGEGIQVPSKEPLNIVSLCSEASYFRLSASKS